MVGPIGTVIARCSLGTHDGLSSQAWPGWMPPAKSFAFPSHWAGTALAQHADVGAKMVRVVATGPSGWLWVLDHARSMPRSAYRTVACLLRRWSLCSH